MSEKHVQNDAPWNKLSATAARLPYNPALAIPFGNSSSSTGLSPSSTTTPATHAEINYAAARFQAPSIIHQQHVNSPNLAVAAHMTATQSAGFAHHLTTPTIASSNVPVVYPPIATATTAAAATSVLTPNPFAVGTGTTASTPVAAMFFQAMNAAASLANTSTAHTAPLSIASPNHGPVLSPAAAVPTVIGNRTTAPDLPSPSSNSSASAITSTGGCSSSFLGSVGGGISGSITSTITENVLNAISGITQQSNTPGRNMGFGVKHAPDEEKLRRVHQMVEANVSEQAKQQIVQILDCISTLKPVEKLLLYLRLPGAAPETDPLRQPQNPLGTRSEINHTINWVRSHLEQDPHVSIPKQDVYNDYIAYCERLDIKPLSTADFGKVMKQVFPGIRPRRLGTRGHSRYCYAAMRKTTKLPTPHLPQLGGDSTQNNEALSSEQLSSTGGVNSLNESNSETWNVIKSWAENLFQIKLDDAKELAALISTGNLSTATNTAIGSGPLGGARTSITHKKFGNRETKEKRSMADIGPLKKRRKKKRKGSSSSESSFTGNQPPLKQKLSGSDKETVQSTITTSTTNATVTATTRIQQITPTNLATEDESIKLVKVKEEFIESPNYQSTQHLTPPNRHVATIADNYLQQQHQHSQPQPQPTKLHQQQQQQQILPINLAPEQRTVLTRAPSTMSAFNPTNVRPGSYGAAAKNLMPKIMELAAAVNANATTSIATESPTTEHGFQPQQLLQQQHQQTTIMIPTIKEEDTDEYNTSNIICKKVRKAQQTKGFWQQPTINAPIVVGGGGGVASAETTTPSIIVATTKTTPIPATTTTTPTNVSHIVPVITTTAATPTPTQTSPIELPTSAATAGATGTAIANTPSPNYLMGPPAAASSTSPFAAITSESSHLTPTPKVASRNMMQLRAKRVAATMAAAAAAAAASETNPTDDLPENLGLPRERVISICNMDKHELDDYFINGEEEENSNDQDTELLQYFQTGDAEEKLNSSDAGKQRIPTAQSATTTALTTATTTSLLANNQHQAMQQHQQNPHTTIQLAAAKAAPNNATVSVQHPQQQRQLQMQQRQLQQQQQQQQQHGTINALGILNTNATSNAILANNTTTTTGVNVLPISTTVTILSTATTTTTSATLTTAEVLNAKMTTAVNKSTVGSASASLAFMSQKHQRQLQQQQQQQQQHHHQQQQQQQQKLQQQKFQVTNITTTKRKIQPSSPIIKHCTFAPISPNINNNNSHSGGNPFTTNIAPNGVGSAPASNSASNCGFFASPGITPTRLRPKPSLLAKQQSLDMDLTGGGSLSFPASAMSTMHDPMIGASRRRRNFSTATSASAPPSPSILHQQQQQQLFNAQHFQNAANQWQSMLSATANPTTSTGFLNDQNSLDLDLFGATNGGGGHGGNHSSTTANYGASFDGAGHLNFDEYVTETQRSQSVPLSQLQRMHSPPLKFMPTTSITAAAAAVAAAAAAATGDAKKSTAERLVEFSTENSLLGSENSSSQHSNPTLNVGIIKLEDPTTADVIASDSAALLDGVDVSEILTSPDFVQNFTSIAQQQGHIDNGGGSSNGITAATTTCSSAGSSSGYSSGACTTFSSNGFSGNIMSRSVPSTPLPHHHHQNLFGQSTVSFYNQRRRSAFLNDELQLSPGSSLTMNKFQNNINNNNNGNNSNNNNCGITFGNTFATRSIYDNSKSMPTTPITTPSFRYSPDFNRDFLINGNTIDDSMSFGGVGSDSLMGSSNIVNVVGTVGGVDDESVNLVGNLNADTLLTADEVSVPGADDVLLGNL